MRMKKKVTWMMMERFVFFFKVMRILLHNSYKICIIRETELVNMTVAMWVLSLTRFQCKKSEYVVNRIYNN